MGRAERRAAERRAGRDVGGEIPGAAQLRDASGYFTAWREGHVPASCDALGVGRRGRAATRCGSAPGGPLHPRDRSARPRPALSFGGGSGGCDA